jgi:alkanesulfonate monooxygenase SsuD/methylene tetrahydromethanopterin reductase-like flavin-dependent oxidoreductase (luciferase family)
MKFGIFYEHQLPRPWEGGQEHRILHEALEQIELADKLGFDTVWEVEHHFLEEYSHSSAPEVFLAAASQRTTNIRLGHGIVAALPGYNHPARIAERVGTLDLLSNGRVELGTGETSSDMELKGFGVERADKRRMWEETVPEIARMMVQRPYTGHDGEFFSMPARNVVPKPMQQPHPPIWVACSQRDTILMAARRGIGALTFSFISPEEAAQWVADYYETFESGDDPIGYDVNPNLAVVTGFMCCGDEQEALDKGLDGFHFFAYSLGHYYAFGQHTPGTTDVWTEFEQNREMMGFAKLEARAKELGQTEQSEGGYDSLRGAIGTPEQIRTFLRAYEEAGVDQVIFISQAGKNRHEDICASLELFAREVMPEFKERSEGREKAKAERLAPAVERLRSLKPVDATPAVDLVVNANPAM